MRYCIHDVFYMKNSIWTWRWCTYHPMLRVPLRNDQALGLLIFVLVILSGCFLSLFHAHLPVTFASCLAPFSSRLRNIKKPTYRACIGRVCVESR